MIPFWRLRFWSDHLPDLISAWKPALPLAFLWTFFERMWWGTIGALALSPVLLGLSVVMVILDTATGCYKVVQNEESVWNTKAFGGMVDKLLKYSVVVIAFSAIAAAGEQAQLPSYAFSWLRDFAYLTIIVREGGSAVENLWGKPLGTLIQQFRGTLGSVTNDA